MKNRFIVIAGLLLPLVVGSLVFAQIFQRGRGGRFRRGGDWTNIDRGDVPRWEVDLNSRKSSSPLLASATNRMDAEVGLSIFPIAI